MKKSLTLALIAAGFTLSACNTTGNGLGEAMQSVSSALPASVRNDPNFSIANDVVSAATVSDAELKDYSRQMIKAEDARNPVAKPGSKYDKRLKKLISKHQKEDGLALNYKVYLVEDVNAFATPDGSIRVYAGLMDIMTDDELRSVIGHEIGHVKHGHSLEKMRTAYIASAGKKVIQKQAAKSGAQIDVAQLAQLGEKFINAQFSQSAEYEADAYGVSFMKKYRYKANASESAMRKLAELGGGQSSLFDSHPGALARADRIRDMVASAE